MIYLLLSTAGSLLSKLDDSSRQIFDICHQ